MTTLPPSPFNLSVETRPPDVVVRIAGDLDFETHGDLLDTVVSLLARRHAARHRIGELRLDFSGLQNIDSSGLSALLRIRRRTDEAGVGLRLEERPAALDRLLDMTGTLELLTAPCPDTGDEPRPGKD
ncbi:STAS domain-containing protein [Streptomyces sp. NPDC046197]|uniref:STAS domain-containing protein n=1 Tax=Streptomyces sp. NPDC046197 TaxID=3154337 RepID=UPI0033D2521F